MKTKTEKTVEPSKKTKIAKKAELDTSSAATLARKKNPKASKLLIENNLPFVSKIRSLKNSKKLILITLIFILLQSNWLSQFFEKYINISGKKIIIYILIIILFILFTHIILSLKN